MRFWDRQNAARAETRRLLLAFAVIFASTMMLAVVGWIGMRDTEDALRETAREFGTTRLASKVRPRLETVLECAISEGILVRDPSGTIRVS